MVTDMGESTVETVAVAESTRYPFQRKGFYTRGYHFAFYYASNKIYWRRSADGDTWGSATDITPSGETPTEGAEIAVWLDRHEEPAHHPYIVYADHDTDSPIYFRRGTVDSNGDLTWDAVWQTAVALAVGVSYRNLTICVDDTNGYPFISYTQTIRADPSSDSRPRVTHSQQMDGTWSTFAGFPDIMNATNDESWVCVVVPYNGVYVMAVYARDSDPIRYDIYNITAETWAGETATVVTMGSDATKMSVTSQRAGKMAAQPRRVHIAFCYTDENLNHISIDDGGVTGPTLIYSSALAMGPSISTRIYGEAVNNYRTLYVFWTTITDEPTADYVCYKKSVNDGANWTKEDGSAGVELWADETGAGLSGANIASSYFEEHHYPTQPAGYIGVLYTNQGASPDYVRWAGLEFADPDEDLLGKAVIRHVGTPVELLGRFEAQAIAELLGKFEAQATAELLGKFEAQAIAELLGKFEAQASAELLGKFEIQDSAELLGKFEAQATVELFGKFELRQAIAELFGKAVVKNVGSAELLGRFEAQASAELLGKAVIRNIGSAELLGRFEAQASAELLGKFEGQAIAELLGRFEAQASAELLGKFEGQATVELPCHFRLSTDHYIIQGVSVEAYLFLTIVV
jgi:hypothetical protein